MAGAQPRKQQTVYWNAAARTLLTVHFGHGFLLPLHHDGGEGKVALVCEVLGSGSCRGQGNRIGFPKALQIGESTKMGGI